MKRSSQGNILFLIIILSNIIISCRENIVSPDEFATNINEPVQINEQNSYTFLLNAEELSIDVMNDAMFSSFTSRISISILDHTSGYIRVTIADRESVSRFNYYGNEEESLFTEALNGYIPGKIGIKAVNFTGKLKIQLSRTF
jgi:hypothetical protein